MLRTLLLIVVVGAACGCESKPSATDQLALKQKEVSASQQRLITATAKSLNAIPLIPDDRDWDYRFQAQDYFASLERRNVLVDITIGDVVRRPDGLVVSGEPRALTYPLLLWVRLHGVPETTARQTGPNDNIVCIGAPTVVAPAGPYLEMQALSEDEIEVETSAVPLIVDVNCVQTWHKN